eukprot:292480-Pelagomonas_calceolata.AAC.4
MATRQTGCVGAEAANLGQPPHVCFKILECTCPETYWNTPVPGLNISHCGGMQFLVVALVVPAWDRV